MSEPTTPDEGCGDPTEPDDDVADVLVTSARVVAALRADLAAAVAAKGWAEDKYAALDTETRAWRDQWAQERDAAVARAETAERMVETQREMLAFDATPGTEQRLRADLAAANARLAAAPSRDVPCVTCGHSIMVHQSNEAGGPCGQCDCEDGALLVNPPKL